jgi:hypothetical protein
VSKLIALQVRISFHVGLIQYHLQDVPCPRECQWSWRDATVQDTFINVLFVIEIREMGAYLCNSRPTHLMLGTSCIVATTKPACGAILVKQG